MELVRCTLASPSKPSHTLLELCSHFSCPSPSECCSLESQIAEWSLLPSTVAWWPSHDFICPHDHHMTITWPYMPTWPYMLTWPSHDLTCSHDHHMTITCSHDHHMTSHAHMTITWPSHDHHMILHAHMTITWPYMLTWPSLVSSPDQIFHTRPAALSKNRVWTRSPVKLGLNHTSISAHCRTNQIAQVK